MSIFTIEISGIYTYLYCFIGYDNVNDYDAIRYFINEIKKIIIIEIMFFLSVKRFVELGIYKVYTLVLYLSLYLPYLLLT